MSGHYESTMQAIGEKEEIARQEVAAARPDKGTMVVYVSRPGEGRAGKSEFPAVVMHHEPDGESVQLLIIYDVDDFVMRPMLREVSEDWPYPAFRYPKSQEAEKFDPSRLNHIRQDLDQVREGLDETRQALYGGYERPEKSVIEIFAVFEKRLLDFGKRLQALERGPS